MLRFIRNRIGTTGDGKELRPGDRHYRAYVGPPRDYDVVAAMVFNLLTSLGLREHHKILDIGCGSLRVGRLLIPYLGKGNYYGVEPNRWLVKDGIRNEIGKDMVRIKKPQFSFQSSLEDYPKCAEFDFAFAQSIFSHCGTDIIRRWLNGVSKHLKSDGALFATFLVAEKDYEGNGWIYPGCVNYTPDTMASIAEEYGFQFRTIPWKHPRQQWAVWAKPDYDIKKCDQISWNTFMDKLYK